MSELPGSPARRYLNRALLYGAIAAIAAPGLAELSARLILIAGGSPELTYARASRALHCRDAETGLLLLCPNSSIAFEHPGGFSYRVSTDARGERIIPGPQTQNETASGSSLWLVGDSIAMAFGNDDADAASSLLARDRPDLRVRNLGVDSLGACGIERLLRKRLSAPNTEPGSAAAAPQPDWIVWIFNPSDYLDDLAPAPRPLLTPALDFLKRWLVLPDALRVLLAPPVRAGAAPAPTAGPAIAADHPTRRCARAIFATVRDLSPARPVLLVYPDIAPDGSGPLPREASAALQAPVVAIARDAGVDILDLQDYFEGVAGVEPQSRESRLYLPNDGHPAPRAQRLFAAALAGIIPSAAGPSNGEPFVQ